MVKFIKNLFKYRGIIWRGNGWRAYWTLVKPRPKKCVECHAVLTEDDGYDTCDKCIQAFMDAAYEADPDAFDDTEEWEKYKKFLIENPEYAKQQLEFLNQIYVPLSPEDQADIFAEDSPTDNKLPI